MKLMINRLDDRKACGKTQRRIGSLNFPAKIWLKIRMPEFRRLIAELRRVKTILDCSKVTLCYSFTFQGYALF